MTGRPGKVAMFEQFAADGITRMFGNPGTVEQGFLDVLETVPGMSYVLALQEAAAVGIADGYARASGGPALVQLHSGVGLGNGVGMLYQAMRGHSPLVVLAGEAGIRYEAMDGQMACDLVSMARPVTKAATRVTHPESLLRVLRRALKTAMTPPRGPVFVALPMDVLDAATHEPAVPTTIPVRVAVPPSEILDRAAEALGRARHPLILIGDGVSVAGAQDVLTRVAEALEAPVWAVDSSEVNMDAAHPLYRGQMGHMFGTDSAARVREADAVLIVGTAVFPEVFPSLASPFHPDAVIVQIDLNDHEIAKNHPVDVALVADPLPTLTALGDRLGVDPHAPLRTREIETPTPAPTASVAEHFYAELARQAPPELVVFDEALTGSGILNRYLPARRPGQYFLTRGGSLGVGIPGAIGAKIARPDAEVVGFTGDGGSMYTPQALWTAAREGVAAKFVVLDNGRYELLDHNIEQYWDERGIASHPTPRSFDLGEPSIGFTDIARGLGVEALRVDHVDSVDKAVRQTLSHPGPFLVHLVTTRRHA